MSGSFFVVFELICKNIPKRYNKFRKICRIFYKNAVYKGERSDFSGRFKDNRALFCPK